MKALRLVPSLLLAAGILASTGVAVALGAAGSWLIVSPALMAAALLAAGFVEFRWLEAPRRTFVMASIHGAAILVVGAISILHDPGATAQLMPILGAGSAGVFAALHSTGKKTGTACARPPGRSC